MADTNKFGRGAQFGDRISPGGPGWDSAHCGDCEAMLADALDGTLGTEEQARFAAHTAACGPCEAMLADAKRGAAWLEMLRDPRPEPPAELLERILLQTSGVAPVSGGVVGVQPAGFGPAAAPGWWGKGLGGRIRAAVRGVGQGSGLVQPRLAMTAAMAFFSIALTMNLTGVRVSGIRTADLSPATLRRSIYRADARVVQYYEGLRVVYELESRVHDLESAPDSSGASPAQSPGGEPQSTKPSGSPERSPATPDGGKAGPGPGSSRRDSLLPRGRFVAVAAAGCDDPESVRAAAARVGTVCEVRKVGFLV